MPSLPLDLILRVAEHADLPTLSAMTQTSQDIHSVIFNYQPSIVKQKLTATLALVPPSGAILSSPGSTERTVLPPYSFYTAQEVERRQFRINSLLENSDSLLLQLIKWDRQTYGFLPEKEMAKLISGLKHAANLVDRLGDCYVEGLCSAGEGADSAIIRRQSHLAQLDLILHRLNLRELAFVKTFVDFCAAAYAQVRPGHSADPAPWIRENAFREALMRNGILIIWAWLEEYLDPVNTSSTSSTLATTTPTETTVTELTDGIIDETMVEIANWERGPRAVDESKFAQADLALPGLCMAIQTAYTQRTGRKAQRAAKDMEWEVLTAIRADDA